MVAPEVSTEHRRNAAVDGQQAGPERTLITVKAYTRHNRNCPKRERSDWARCNCVKWLYIYRDGKYKLVSAKTRSWERAEQEAREIRDSFDSIKQLQRQVEGLNGSPVAAEAEGTGLSGSGSGTRAVIPLPSVIV